MNFNEFTFEGLPEINFEHFDKQVDVLVGNDAETVRMNFINRFILKDSQYYKERIVEKKLFSDGLCYTGYLWDCINVYDVITISQVLEELRNIDQDVYVLWDIHSVVKVFADDYWRYPKLSVLSVNSLKLISGLRFLPEDIYIFSDFLNWAYILTYEHHDKGRTCFKAYPITDESNPVLSNF
jgi:hypothetical protein